MSVISFYGAGDDLVEVEGLISDEFPVKNGSWSGTLEAPNGETAIVYVDLRDNGCWTVTLGRYEEDYALPDWETKLISNDKACRYSTYLQIFVPEGTKFTVNK